MNAELRKLASSPPYGRFVSRSPDVVVCRCGDPVPSWSLSGRCLSCDLAALEQTTPPMLLSCGACGRLVPKVDAAEGVLSIQCRHDGTFVVREA